MQKKSFKPCAMAMLVEDKTKNCLQKTYGLPEFKTAALCYTLGFLRYKPLRTLGLLL